MQSRYLDVDYDNFKNATGHWQGEQGAPYEDALSNVWAVMYDYQRRKYGPGIYDRLNAEHEGGMFEGEDEFFEDDEDEEEEEDAEDIAGMARHEPEPDDEVLLVRDESGIPIGVIWWPEHWTSPEEAYAAAVQAGVLELVGRPAFNKEQWRDTKTHCGMRMPAFDFEAKDVPPAGDVVG